MKCRIGTESRKDPLGIFSPKLRAVDRLRNVHFPACFEPAPWSLRFLNIPVKLDTAKGVA